jgi:hypothetical protein
VGTIMLICLVRTNLPTQRHISVGGLACCAEPTH